MDSDPAIPHRGRGRGRGLRPVVIVATALLFAAALAGCGSSNASSSKVALQRSCQQVAAVLSDGPDPDVDPVGYAEAQVLPLRQLPRSGEPVHAAIDGLASAYQQFSSTKGSRAAKAAVSDASHRMDLICPGSTQ
jgi:hypothetical protein